MVCLLVVTGDSGIGVDWIGPGEVKVLAGFLRESRGVLYIGEATEEGTKRYLWAPIDNVIGISRHCRSVGVSLCISVEGDKSSQEIFKCWFLYL